QPMITKIIHAIRSIYLRQENSFRDHQGLAWSNGSLVTYGRCERCGNPLPAANSCLVPRNSLKASSERSYGLRAAVMTHARGRRSVILIRVAWNVGGRCYSAAVPRNRAGGYSLCRPEGLPYDRRVKVTMSISLAPELGEAVRAAAAEAARELGWTGRRRERAALSSAAGGRGHGAAGGGGRGGGGWGPRALALALGKRAL